MKCYGISGNAWCHIPAQADRMIAEMGEKVDAILILIGTNDYAGGRPLGQWYDETEAEVNWWGQMHKLKQRSFSHAANTVRGDVNVALEKLKKRYPLAQIVLMTPTKRAFFTCGGNNIQPAEDWPNGGDRDVFFDHFRLTGQDMGWKDYAETGVWDEQVPRDNAYRDGWNGITFPQWVE